MDEVTQSHLNEKIKLKVFIEDKLNEIRGCDFDERNDIKYLSDDIIQRLEYSKGVKEFSNLNIHIDSVIKDIRGTMYHHLSGLLSMKKSAAKRIKEEKLSTVKKELRIGFMWFLDELNK